MHCIAIVDVVVVVVADAELLYHFIAYLTCSSFCRISTKQCPRSIPNAISGLHPNIWSDPNSLTTQFIMASRLCTAARFAHTIRSQYQKQWFLLRLQFRRCFYVDAIMLLANRLSAKHEWKMYNSVEETPLVFKLSRLCRCLARSRITAVCDSVYDSNTYNTVIHTHIRQIHIEM